MVNGVGQVEGKNDGVCCEGEREVYQRDGRKPQRWLILRNRQGDASGIENGAHIDAVIASGPTVAVMREHGSAA